MYKDGHRFTPAGGVFAVALIVCGLSMFPGCAAPTVAEPLAQTLGASDPETQLEFWHRLADQPVTSNDDAFHGLLLFLDGEDAHAGYDARVANLKQRGLLPGGFSEPANQAVSRGTLSVCITKALGIKGGVMNRLAPDCSRYAVRELVYLNLYPPSSPNQTFSGSEFLGIVGRMEDWQRVNPDSPAAQMPAEPPATQPG